MQEKPKEQNDIEHQIDYLTTVKTNQGIGACRKQPVSDAVEHAGTDHSDGPNKGRWTLDEHLRFVEALQIYGKEWKLVQEHVGTRSSTQARSHAQKFFVKLDKRGQNLEEFLNRIDLDAVRQKLIEAGSDQDYEDPECLNLISSQKTKTIDTDTSPTK